MQIIKNLIMKRIIFFGLILISSFALGQNPVISKAHSVYVNYSIMSFDRFEPWMEGIDANADAHFYVPMNGFGLGYEYSFPVLKTAPLLVSAGANFNYSFGTKEYMDDSYGPNEKWKRELKYGFISVPVNVEYSLCLGEFLVSPQIGIGMKFNCFFREAYYRNLTDKTAEYSMNKILLPENLNYNPESSFLQFFGDIGLNISLKKWFVGCSYFYDFNHFKKEEVYIIDGTGTIIEYSTVDYNTFQIRLGYRL